MKTLPHLQGSKTKYIHLIYNEILNHLTGGGRYDIVTLLLGSFEGRSLALKVSTARNVLEQEMTEMKKLMMALAALCVASVTNAVTFGWSKDITTAGVTVGASDDFPSVDAWTGSSGGLMSYAIKFTVTALPTSGSNVIFKLSNSSQGGATTNTNNNGVQVSITSEGKLIIAISNHSEEGWFSGETGNDGTNSTTQNPVIAPNGTYVLGVTVDNNSTSKGNVKVYLNDTQVAVSGSGGAYHFYKAVLDQLMCGADGITTDMTVYAAEGIATGADFSNLPEPTALALLALGVAGLALRRKVA